MTTVTMSQTLPSFRTHSGILGLFRDLLIIAFCAAIVAAFLVQVWRAPQPGQLEDAQRPAAVHHRL